MTIQEAIRSGLPFKRPCHKIWIIENPSRLRALPNAEVDNDKIHIYKPFIWEDGLTFHFTEESILARDWEVKND